MPLRENGTLPVSGKWHGTIWLLSSSTDTTARFQVVPYRAFTLPRAVCVDGAMGAVVSPPWPVVPLVHVFAHNG